MKSFLSGETFELNAIERAKRSVIDSGCELIDLTETNPTNCGLLFPKDILADAFKCYHTNRVYEPQAKGRLEARKKIVEYYAKRAPQLKLTPEQIYLTASTSESYSLLFSLLGDAGDEFLAPNPTYPLFELLSAHAKVRLKYYVLDHKSDWNIAPSTISDLVTAKTKSLLIISPHNPTGAVHKTRVQEIVDLAKPIIADEVFSEFNLIGRNCPAIGEIYPELPVFHLNGISKMFALPDLKLGWIALNEPAYEIFGERLEHLNDIFLSANCYSQRLIDNLFLAGRTFPEQIRGKLLKNLNFIAEELNECPHLKLCPPEAGWNCLLEYFGALEEEDVVLECIKQGVFVHPGYYYGFEEGKYLVLSLLSEQSNLAKGLSVIRRVIA
jgi:aspartate/methionine/tyrosine aminotransferase